MSEQTSQRQMVKSSRFKRFFDKPGGFWLTGVMLFFLAFLLGFYVWLPVEFLGDRLAREVERHTSLKVTVGKISLSPLLTLQSRDVSLQVAQLSAAPLLIEQVKLKPRWLSLFSSDQVLELRAQLLSGTLEGSVRRSSALQISGSNLQFTAPLQAQSSLALAGILTSGKINSAYILRKDTASQIDLDFDRVLLKGVGVVSEGVDGLLLGKIQLQATGQGRAFKIDLLQARGGEVEAKGEGTLLVTVNPQNSLINLSLNLQTTPKTSPEITNLLELVGKKQSDGSFLLKLGGTLANPVISP